MALFGAGTWLATRGGLRETADGAPPRFALGRIVRDYARVLGRRDVSATDCKATRSEGLHTGTCWAYECADVPPKRARLDRTAGSDGHRARESGSLDGVKATLHVPDELATAYFASRRRTVAGSTYSREAVDHCPQGACHVRYCLSKQGGTGLQGCCRA
jgi:hypothetical protein